MEADRCDSVMGASKNEEFRSRATQPLDERTIFRGSLMKVCRKIFVLLLLSFYCGFAFPLFAHAAPVRDPGAIHISSESMEAMDQSGKVVFTGNVVATQDDLTIHSDRLDVHYVKAGENVKGEEGGRSVEKMVATGHVRITKGARTATGEKAVYDRRAETVTISGAAQVWEGRNRVSGDVIILYMNEDRSVVQSGSKGKVEAVVYPDEKGKAQGEK